MCLKCLSSRLIKTIPLDLTHKKKIIWHVHKRFTMGIRKVKVHMKLLIMLQVLFAQSDIETKLMQSDYQFNVN